MLVNEMNTSDSIEPFDDFNQAKLDRLLLEGLKPIVPNPMRQETLRSNIMQRLAQSIKEEAGLMTVRLKDGAWQKLKTGIRFKQLWNGPEGNSVLIEFAPGASLSAHRHNWMEEGIVLRGDLHMGELELGPMDYHLSAIGSRHASIQSRQGALAYLRGTSLGDNASVLREFLGGFLPAQGEPSLTVFAKDTKDWHEVAKGVSRKKLCANDNRVSYFYRMEPESEVPEHSHPQDEECMVLQGELFFGDILLKAMDYQLAPTGSMHGKIYTDVGSILFVRGAKD